PPPSQRDEHMPIETSLADVDMVFAKTSDGLTLPIIDVTRPPFAMPDDPASLAGMQNNFFEWHRRQQMPRFLTSLLMRLAARRSRLMRALFQSDQGYLDSITTYVMKLGADHLPHGFDGPMDRRIAGAPHVPLLRLRMQQIAKFLAEALQAPLTRAAHA